MIIDMIKWGSSLLAGFSILFLTGPTLGELFATMAPVYLPGTKLTLKKLDLPYEEVAFPTSDGLVLRGWFFPADDPASPAIIYAPATARDQRSGISLVTPFHQANYHVLLFSYRGHGLSDGDPFGFTYGAQESRDIDAAVAFLADEKGIDQIGLVGHSAGAVSAILSAARNPRVDALVAASPYSSMEEIWNNNRPWFFPAGLHEFTLRLVELRKQFSRHTVRPQDVIHQIAPRPFLLIHSDGDRRITHTQAMALFTAAGAPKALWLVENATHGEVRSVVMDGQVERIIAFFDGAFGRFAAPTDSGHDQPLRLIHSR
jgi:dipeptidyl aminopeptidase/acylaminoacyl peptidase